MTSRVFRWRRTDMPGLEVLHLQPDPGGVRVRSTVVVAGDDPFGAEYEWLLDTDLRTRRLSLHVIRGEATSLIVERTGPAAWRVNESPRRDLEGCEEIDLAITPFCNTLALRRFGAPPGGPGELTTLYVSFPSLDCSPSRQRYEKLGDTTFKYIDLGLVPGFEATLSVDDQGFVRSYEGLFELIG